jgi:hypothetical protein
MQTLVTCSSENDLSIAREITSYIEANCPWIRTEAYATTADAILEAVERGLSSDVVLLLLSPDSIPSPWLRQHREPILVHEARNSGTPVAFVLVRDCGFPETFRKQRFFEARADARRDGIRQLRQWLFSQKPLRGESTEILPPGSGRHTDRCELTARLETLVLDTPGTLADVPRELALAFASEHSRALDGVFGIECLGRSYAGVLGDTARALGLRLSGTTDQNASALREFCAARRCLFVFDGLTIEHRHLLTFGGSSSIIFSDPGDVGSNILSLAQAVDLFAGWRSDPARCLEQLRSAEYHLRSGNDPRVRQLGAYMFGLLRHEERFAEGYELLEMLCERAWDEGNRLDLERWQREKGWIEEAWGLRRSPALYLGAGNEPVQMGFDFCM